MSWNPSPKVADCRNIARKWGKEQVIVLALDRGAGTLHRADSGVSRPRRDAGHGPGCAACVTRRRTRSRVRLNQGQYGLDRPF